MIHQTQHRKIFHDEDFFSVPIAESISIGLLIAAGKNTYKLIQNKKTFSEALIDTGIDAASRAGTIGLSGWCWKSNYWNTIRRTLWVHSRKARGRSIRLISW